MYELFERQFLLMKERGWDSIYIYVDIHDTCIKANYTIKELPTEFFPKAKNILQRMSKRSDCCLVLYTCSYPSEIKKYIAFFKENDIHFDHVNKIRGLRNTAFGCFKQKPYMNILLDDKAGFKPERDWEEIGRFLDEKERNKA